MRLATCQTHYEKSRLYRSLDLTGTQAAGADVDMNGSSVDNCFNAAHIGLPSMVGPYVRVRDLNTEGDSLAADITFCHSSKPP